MPSLSLVTLLLTASLSASASPINLPLEVLNSASGLGTPPSDTKGPLIAPAQVINEVGSALPVVNPLKQVLSSGSSKRITLPLVRRFNATGAANVLKFDQARAQAIRQRAQARSGYPEDTDEGSLSAISGHFDVPATSQIVSYVVSALIGEPAIEYHLLVDTGSSNTWVGADVLRPYVPTLTSHATGNTENVKYGSGEFLGGEYLDRITLAKGLTLTNQSIGGAAFSKGFDGVDGILGIGPQDLTCGSFAPDVKKCVPTVTDTAWNMGLLSNHSIGISFAPSQSKSDTNGELTFGGVDESKFHAPLNYVPLTTTAPAKYFVGIDQDITYGKGRPVLPSTSGILDTGTTLVLIASDAFKAYKEYTGGVPDETVGLLRITPEQYDKLESLYFNIGGTSYELTPNAQLWPRALNEAIGGTSDNIYLIVNDYGSPSGKGLDFINGMSFLERFYMVYDIGGSRAGLAKTPFTHDDSN